MTISKAYNLLEREGVLIRNRGKPMTVAPRARRQGSRHERARQLEEQIEQLVFAARQLELQKEDLNALIERTWEEKDADTRRQRTRS